MVLYCVTAESLNVREIPSGKIIGQLKQDDLVVSSENVNDDGWLPIELNGGQKRFIFHNYVTQLQKEYPTWLEIACKELWVKEYAGNPANPRIVEYLHTTSLDDSDAHSDETSWCSAFVNWCMKTSGLTNTHKANARSWLDWGINLAQPKLGCVVVFARGTDGWSGHVGFYVGETHTHIKVFGGNQGDQVNISLYPKDGENHGTKYKLLGYRWNK